MNWRKSLDDLGFACFVALLIVSLIFTFAAAPLILLIGWLVVKILK